MEHSVLARTARGRWHHALRSSRSDRRDRRAPERSSSRGDARGQDRRAKPTRPSKPSWRGWVRSRRRSPSARAADAADRADRDDWRTGLAADFRHALRVAAPRSRLLDGRDPDAGDRHRRMHRGVQHHQRAAAGHRCPIPNPEQLVDGVGNRRRQPRAHLHRRASQSTKTGNGKRGAFRSLGIWEYRTFNVASDAGAGAGPGHSRDRRACSRCWACRRRWAASSRERKKRRAIDVAVISDGVWRTHLGGEPTAIGRRCASTAKPIEVIGVMPPGFQFPRQEQRRVGAVCADRAGSRARFAFVLGRGAAEAGA